MLCGSNSVVECQLPKLDVAGSSPVSRSKIWTLSSVPKDFAGESIKVNIGRLAQLVQSDALTRHRS